MSIKKTLNWIKHHKILTTIAAITLLLIISPPGPDIGSPEWKMEKYTKACIEGLSKGLLTNTAEYKICTQDLSYDIDGIEPREEIDVNGLIINEACRKLRDNGWTIHQINGNDETEKSDCSDIINTIEGSDYNQLEQNVSLTFTNHIQQEQEDSGDENDSKEETKTEEAPVSSGEKEDIIEIEPVSELEKLSISLATQAKTNRFDDSNQCFVEHKADSTKFLNDKALAKNATTIFIETGKKVFEDENCKTFVFYYNASTDDESSDGVRIVSFAIDKPIFNDYTWDTLHDKPVGIQLKQENVIGIPLASSLEPKDFIYL